MREVAVTREWLVLRSEPSSDPCAIVGQQVTIDRRAHGASLQMSSDEAVVLFELLTRFEESETLAIEHDAERIVLASLQGALERVLREPFRADYGEIVTSARARITARFGA